MVRLLQIYKSIIGGVAFIPLIVMVLFTMLALFLTLSPIVSSINSFVYAGGYFEIRTSETALAVLTSILTGMISLTVFGFSMMIVVVNQAAANYSPKVVETLMSKRSNQYILGVNLGTIVFALIVLMHVDNRKVEGGVPELAILATVVLTIICLLLFVRFINNISNAVRITNIVRFIYKATKSSLSHHKLKKVLIPHDIDLTGWTMYTAGHAGYFQMLRTKSILRILKRHDALLKVIPLPGTRYLRHEPLFMVSKPLDEDVVDQLRAEFVTYKGEPIGENPVYGFRQLREIAVKALSPGINDPGVAVVCIEHLTELLSLELDRGHQYGMEDKDGKYMIVCSEYDFRALLELSFLPIKWYGRCDITVLSALLHAVHQLVRADVDRRVRKPLSVYFASLVTAAAESATSSPERDILEGGIDELRNMRYFDASLFERWPPPQHNPEGF